MTESALSEWLDKQAITEILYRYCRAIDRFDLDALRRVYWPDGEDYHGAVDGSAQTFCEFFANFAGEGSIYAASHHTLINILIEIEDASARVESYYHAYHLIVDEGIAQDEFVGGRYVDRFEKRDGEWRIKKRLTVYDWGRKDPATERLWDRVPGNYIFGQRSRKDPVYGAGG
jgi:hypothetical protein